MTRKSQNLLPSDRSFGLTFVTVFAVAGAWMLWKASIHWAVTFGVAGAFLLAALAFPRMLRPLNIAWMQFGLLLNRVVSRFDRSGSPLVIPHVATQGPAYDLEKGFHRSTGSQANSRLERAG